MNEAIIPEIPEKMEALVSYGPKDSRLERVLVPRIKEPGELLLKIEGCGICAGDIKAYMGAEVFWGNAKTPPYLEPPAIGGHEFVGTIVEIGEHAAAEKNLRLGDRVAVEQIVPCGKCRYCERGQYSLCKKHDVFGFKNYLNGGFAEYVLLPQNARVYKIPDKMPLESAVLIEPYSCSYHAVERAQLTKGDFLVISGCGPLGLGMVAAAKLKSPAKIAALDLFDKRLEHALELGADIAINPKKTDAAKQILDMSDGYGCDVYIEATGHPASVLQGLEAICKGGRFVEFSLFGEPVNCNWSVIGDQKELAIYGVSLSPGCFPAVIEKIGSGQLKTLGIVTHKFKLQEYKEAFSTCINGADSVKVIFADC
ncbi:MAG: alcohol dehydrogenase catalytic domain-containing protein [Oscillospiraceae bacterium]|nr:alcohol dehydrogenase catalytic domain-containing protein [Oscillospiraceae bacterium]